MNNTIKTLLLLCMAPAALMAADDRDAPMRIEADQVQMNEANGESIYRGKVRLSQGSLLIEADQIIIRSPQNGARRLIIQGNPARFDKRDENGKRLRGAALNIDYNDENEQLILRGEAYLNDGKREFRSDLIRYDNRADHIEAGQPGNGDRVTIIIQPEEKPKTSP